MPPTDAQRYAYSCLMWWFYSLRAFCRNVSGLNNHAGLGDDPNAVLFRLLRSFNERLLEPMPDREYVTDAAAPGRGRYIYRQQVM